MEEREKTLTTFDEILTSRQTEVKRKGPPRTIPRHTKKTSVIPNRELMERRRDWTRREKRKT